MSKKEADARQELEQARNARFAKEGEVSILRSNIDKVRFAELIISAELIKHRGVL